MNAELKSLKKELLAKRSDLAFVIGNGINNYAYYPDDSCKWDKLIFNAWKEVTGSTISSIKGMSLTEFYNLLEIKTGLPDKDLKPKVLDSLKHLKPNSFHEEFGDYLVGWDVPVLTTNYDSNIEFDLFDRHIVRHPKHPDKVMSAHYPWDRYYGLKGKTNPREGFGVWHINGMFDFRQSIKLSLTEYINQSVHARKYIHAGNEPYDDFGNKNHEQWPGYNTWLHIVFNCSLCIFGLSLDRDETFLRWLLIERKKYFMKYPDRAKEGWFIYTSKKEMEKNPGQKIFLNEVGFKTVSADSYKSLYEEFIALP